MSAKSERSKKEIPSEESRCCSLPIVPPRKLDPGISPNREFLIRYNEKKWANYTVLHYMFLDAPEEWVGSDVQKQAVRDAFKQWKDLGIGLVFVEVNDPTEAEIRIGFEPGGSWSYVGRDCLTYAPDPSERTMNFGWDLTTPYGRDTALHETGHALGFPHEHQNPNAGISWNEAAVYDYFSQGPDGWSADQIYNNVLRKISPSVVGGSLWDKDSIMHYWFESGLIVKPEEYQTNRLVPLPGLTQTDIDEVLKFYPGGSNEQFPELERYRSQLVTIGPGEQLDFVIKPTISRKYTMQTFGPMDTVMVLFEDVNNTPVYLSGDDDSGTKFNSRIQYRLLAGRTYYLRLRLYYNDSDGEGAIMAW